MKLTLFSTFVGKSDVVWFVFSSLFAPITNLSGAVDSLKLATPLIFAGLSVAFAFRAGLFNIGASGQLTMGAILATLVGVYAPIPGPLLAIDGGAGGGSGRGAVGRDSLDCSRPASAAREVINTIMLNYIASGIFVFLVGSNTYTFFGRTVTIPFKAEGSNPSSNLLQSSRTVAVDSADARPEYRRAGPPDAGADLRRWWQGVGLYYGLRRNRWRVLACRGRARW